MTTSPEPGLSTSNVSPGDADCVADDTAEAWPVVEVSVMLMGAPLEAVVPRLAWPVGRASCGAVQHVGIGAATREMGSGVALGRPGAGRGSKLLAIQGAADVVMAPSRRSVVAVISETAMA